ncbi:MAG: hypothetical protein ABUS57_02400 [Pseudomonadota bacterium]
MRSTITLITLGLVGTAALISGAARRQRIPVKLSTPPQPVRDAGPEHMENPPHRWDMVDQQADESFPASDPPGNY